MTRLLALLPLVGCVMAMMGGMPEGADSAKGLSADGASAPASGGSGGEQTIELNIGPVQIKLIGSFDGQNAWDWKGAKPGDNATVHQVTVGDMRDGKPFLGYEPPSLNAAPGDYVQFNFKAQNHTLTQSTLEKPCVKMEGGMDSGFMPNPNNTMATPPSMMVVINDTKPLWFYCRQKDHCGKGMAFGLNPGTAEKMDEFLANAKAQNSSEAGAANGLAAAGGAPGAGAAGAPGAGAGDAKNGLPPSSPIASPTAAPLANLVPGDAAAAGGNPAGAGGNPAGAGGDQAAAGGNPAGAGGDQAGAGGNPAGAGGDQAGADGNPAGAGGDQAGAGGNPAGAGGDQAGADGNPAGTGGDQAGAGGNPAGAGGDQAGAAGGAGGANSTAADANNLSSNSTGAAGDQAGGAGAEDACTCNCVCDLGQPGMGGMIGSIPLPNSGATRKREVVF